MLIWSLDLAFLLTLGLVSACLGYLYLLALAGWRAPHTVFPAQSRHRFAIAIPAHNEEATIGRTIKVLQAIEYPAALFEVFVLADNCEDATAQVASGQGASVFERSEVERRGKGYALAFLFEKILAREPLFDAVVVFDADTLVDVSFLKVMDAFLGQGHQVVQGNHIIANPAESWLSAVMSIAFLMDNRLRNWGRSNLGLSSKLMGDAMCFSREVLEKHPWHTQSQTEDAEYKALLALADVRVVFAPAAKAYGEMVTDLGSAGGQRARWMRGRAEVTRRWAFPLLQQGLLKQSWTLIDSALDLLLPSFSTLIILTFLSTLSLGLTISSNPWPWVWLLCVWLGLVVYPLLALILVRAPARTYFYLLLAPIYAVWRTWLRLAVRLQRGSRPWIRTARSTETKAFRQ